MSNTIIVSERRRAWPDDLKLQMLAEAQEAGESICSVARRYEIDPAQMYQWRKKFREKDQAQPAMLSVEVCDTPSKPSSLVMPAELPDVAPVEPQGDFRTEDNSIEIALGNGRHLFAPSCIEPKRLAQLVAALETS